MRAYVVGVGLTRFEKPGRRAGWDYPAMAKESGTVAAARVALQHNIGLGGAAVVTAYRRAT